jgi:hypothetical protein
MSDTESCAAGERCSCGTDSERRKACNLIRRAPEVIYGLVFEAPSQKPLIDKHCFGDCGRISMGGVVMDEMLGPLLICCEKVCPWLEKETDEPFGTTMSFGRPHTLYLRKLTDTPEAAL